MACSKKTLYGNKKPVNRKASDILLHDWKHTIIMACSKTY